MTRRIRRSLNRSQHDLADELREWVVANIAPGQPFYVFGDTVLRLPKDTAAR